MSRFRDRHHEPRTARGREIVANRLREIYTINEVRWLRDGELVNCVMRSRSTACDGLPDALGERWAERFRISHLIRNLRESRS
jgi:hypothetical protein